jgi:uncharacterized RDD family membrane protein YckC
VADSARLAAMRCPKCHYLSFDSGERCRNCGYDFSLVAKPAAELDLPVAPEPEGPLADLSLAAPASDAPAPGVPTPAGAPRSPARLRPGAETPDPVAAELPLFQDVPGADLPRAGAFPPPRPPLAVRRTPPVATRRTAGPTPVEFHLDLEAPSATPPVTSGVVPALGQAAASVSRAPRSVGDAAPGRRLAAAGIDALLLVGLDAAIVHFTLQVAGLAWSELALVPWVPVAAFLALVDGVYSVVFTGSGGQTLGKMAAGIRVACAEGGAAPGYRRALGRTAACVLSVVPFGLGFLPALLAHDRRALHDRLAGTRVVTTG